MLLLSASSGMCANGTQHCRAGHGMEQRPLSLAQTGIEMGIGYGVSFFCSTYLPHLGRGFGFKRSNAGIRLFY